MTAVRVAVSLEARELELAKSDENRRVEGMLSPLHGKNQACTEGEGRTETAVSTSYPRDDHGVPMGGPWDAHGMPVGSSCELMGYPWATHSYSWDTYPLDARRIPMATTGNGWPARPVS